MVVVVVGEREVSGSERESGRKLKLNGGSVGDITRAPSRAYAVLLALVVSSSSSNHMHPIIVRRSLWC